MKYLIIKDKQKRKLFLVLELKLLYLKVLYLEALNIKNEKLIYFLYKKYIKIHFKLNYIKFKNRCIITGRSKSIYRDLKISRLMFRNYVKLGLGNGINKSSW